MTALVKCRASSAQGLDALVVHFHRLAYGGEIEFEKARPRPTAVGQFREMVAAKPK